MSGAGPELGTGHLQGEPPCHREDGRPHARRQLTTTTLQEGSTRVVDFVAVGGMATRDDRPASGRMAWDIEIVANELPCVVVPAAGEEPVVPEVEQRGTVDRDAEGHFTARLAPPPLAYGEADVTGMVGLHVPNERAAIAAVLEEPRRPGASLCRPGDETACDCGRFVLRSEHVRVGRLDGRDRVAQQFGDEVYRRSRFEEVRRVGVAEAVWVRAGVHAAEHMTERVDALWFAAFVAEHQLGPVGRPQFAGAQPFFDLRLAPGPQHGDGLGHQRHGAVGAFALRRFQLGATAWLRA